MTTYNHPGLDPRLERLAELLELRFRSTGHLPDLDSAIQLTYAASMATYPTRDYPTNDDLIPFWLNIGERLGRRFGATGNSVDIEDAIWYLSLAAKYITQDSLFYVDVLVELAFTLDLRYEKLGNLKDLDWAISLRQQVRWASVEQDELWLDCLHGLGGDLATRYKNFGQLGDLQDAINVAHVAIIRMIVISSKDDLQRDCFYELGTKFGLLYEATNTIDHLDLAIGWSRRAVGPSGARIEVFHHLEHLLTLRYKKTH